MCLADGSQGPVGHGFLKFKPLLPPAKRRISLARSTVFLARSTALWALDMDFLKSEDMSSLDEMRIHAFG